jgi:hypothetical protein
LSPIETRIPEVTQLDTQRLLKTLAIAAGLALTAVIPASATPTAVTVHLDGTHPPDSDYHQGTFTAPSPLCPSGAWQGNGQGSRVYTCADGSGTFTANFNGYLEHTAGASGPWSIVGGTGTYATLRGRGTATIDSSTGPNGNPITFSDTWQGVVDFDNVAPAIKVQRATATRLPKPRGGYLLHLSFACPDNVTGNTLSYRVVVGTAASDLATRTGKTTAAASLSLRVRPPRSARFLRVEITATDPVGNVRTITRRVRLGGQQK